MCSFPFKFQCRLLSQWFAKERGVKKTGSNHPRYSRFALEKKYKYSKGQRERRHDAELCDASKTFIYHVRRRRAKCEVANNMLNRRSITTKIRKQLRGKSAKMNGTAKINTNEQDDDVSPQTLMNSILQGQTVYRI
jgi:hypothetical protein